MKILLIKNYALEPLSSTRIKNGLPYTNFHASGNRFYKTPMNMQRLLMKNPEDK